MKKKRGPILVTDLKSKKKARNRKRVDAKNAYAFVNNGGKSLGARAMGEVSRRIAEMAAGYEDRIVESKPFRITISLIKRTPIGSIAQKLGESLRQLIRTK